MPTVKLSGGKVVTKAGKVSCTCCAAICFGACLTVAEQAALSGSYYFEEKNGATITQEGEVVRFTDCGWFGDFGGQPLNLAFGSSPCQWAATTDTSDSFGAPYVKTGTDLTTPIGTYVSIDVPGYTVEITAFP